MQIEPQTKQSLIEEHYYINVDNDYWYDCIIDEFIEDMWLYGIEVEKVHFTGFCSQGDGACFEGSYSYKSGLLKEIKEYAPKDKELHRIAKELQLIKYRGVSASIKHSGQYYHEMCANISVYQEEDDGYSDDDAPIEIADDIAELMRDLMRWLYKSLNDQYDYLTSEEVVIEAIEANDYQFTDNGDIF